MAHSPTLAPGQVSIPSIMNQDGVAALPLTVTFLRDGQPTDVVFLEFEVQETGVATIVVRGPANIVNFFPQGDHLSVGRYVFRFTLPLTATLDAAHRVSFFYKFDLTQSEVNKNIDFMVAAETTKDLPDLPVGQYITEEEFREEGFEEGRFESDRIVRLIKGASRRIEKITRRWFEPRLVTFFLDGTGSRRLPMPAPIIEIHQVRIVTRESIVTTSLDELDLDSISIYNRHMRGIMTPDDREDPRIEFATLSGSLVTGFSRFPKGRQNIQVTGIFGYTDPDRSVGPYGATPEDIKDVCRKLVVRGLPKMEDLHEREDATKRALISSERAGTWGTSLRAHPGLSESGITGDPEIDLILMQYRSPMHIGSAGGVVWEWERARRPIGVL